MHPRFRTALGLLSVLAASAAFFGLSPTTAHSAPSADPPNVVIVLLDDARTDDLSTLPEVRSLIGDEGATFTNTFSPFPLCCPARATLLTGEYAHNHGVLDNKAPLGGFTAFDDSSTLATWLDPTYTTGWIGKYLNGYGGSTSEHYVPPGWDMWRASIGPVYNYLRPRYDVNGEVVDYPGRYRTNVDVEATADFIDAHANQPDPFFLVASILSPHAGTPSEPDDPNVVYHTGRFATPNVAAGFRDAFADLPLTANPAFNEKNVGDKPLQSPPLATWEVKALTEVNQQRRESMLSGQHAVTRVVDSLRAAGELDNTYIVVFSDNGYMLGEHRIRGGKVFPYEPAVKVPMLIRGPGIPAGTVVRQPTGLHDLAPTVLAMTGSEGAQGQAVIDGVNLLPLIANPSLRKGRPIVLEAGPESTRDPAYRFHGIRTPQWKYVERGTGEKEMYSMTDDPYELSNLAGKAQYEQTQADMKALLDQYKFCEGAGCR